MPSSRAGRCPRGIGEAIKSVGEMRAADGCASLDELFSPGVTGKRRRKVLAEAVKLQNYQFNCHGQLGQRYTSSAIVRDGATFPAPTRAPELYHHPTTTPGACTPHAWIERNGKVASARDVVGQSVFTVLTGSQNSRSSASVSLQHLHCLRRL